MSTIGCYSVPGRRVYVWPGQGCAVQTRRPWVAGPRAASVAAALLLAHSPASSVDAWERNNVLISVNN